MITRWLTCSLYCLGLLPLGLTSAADWPTHRHDNRRSGVTSEQLEATRLAPVWSWSSSHPPVPAWAGPARWDAYRNLRGQPEMRNYDWVFHVAVADGRLVFGSSVDDTVRCLDAATGQELWRYVTDGPVRLAPTIDHSQVYFGSDDGYAYCLSLADGTLIWRHSAGDGHRKVLNNGRLISFWPVRTGVLVDDGRAYFGASLLPWKPSYLCALHADTGESSGAGCYVTPLEQVTLEGPPAASNRLLVFPQGRVPPALFDRISGSSRGTLDGGGGSFVILPSETEIVHGPAAEPRQGAIARSNSPPDPQQKAPIATYPQGRSIVVEGTVAYMITAQQVIVSDWNQRRVLWTRRTTSPHELLLAGDTLFVGAEDRVSAYRAQTGQLLWSHHVTGRVYGLAVAAGRLYVSSDAGTISAFEPIAEATDELPADEIAAAQPSGLEPPVTAALTPIQPIEDSHLIGRWVFQSPHVHATRVDDLNGRHPAVIAGPVQLVRVNDRQALELNGSDNVVQICPDFRQARLPQAAISAEGWLRMDAGMGWMSLVGAFQDNGDYERGWVLGAQENKLSFAVASEKTKRLTYLTDQAPVEFGRWYHVAGVYDGTTLALYVNGKLANQTTAQSGDILYPSQACYEIGAYHDQDEDYRLKGLIHEVRVYSRALNAEEIASHYAERASSFPEPVTQSYDGPKTQIAIGPWLEFVRPGEAKVRWITSEPAPTVLEYRLEGDTDGEWVQLTDEKLQHEHEVRIPGLRHRRIYQYRIGILSGQAQGEVLECDTYFDFSVDVGERSDPGQSPAGTGSTASELAERIMRDADCDRGMALLLGCEDPSLAAALARQSRLQVVAFETDPQRVAAAREQLLREELYGHRVTVHQVDSLDQVPTPRNWADLVLTTIAPSTGLLRCAPSVIAAELRPDGGVAVVVDPAANRHVPADSLALAAQQIGIDVEVSELADGWIKLVRAPLRGAGEWTHQYGKADNSAYGGEALGGAGDSTAFETQWVGRPGPRFKPDRNGRKPAPLSAGGRLYVQGMQRIAAIVPYNGQVLWCLEIPQLARFNIPRDCGNWVADQDHVYAVVKNHCWKINGRTGEVEQFFRVDIPEGSDEAWEWGYVARVDDLLMGSAVRPGAPFTNFWGGSDEGWYDAVSGPATAKVCSDELFAKYAADGGLKWTYRDGLILNSTITVGGGPDGKHLVYFVESRNRELSAQAERRISSEGLWQQQFLVALDLHTGEKVWESAIDTVDGVTMVSLACGSGKLALALSQSNTYHVCIYDASSGREAWTSSFPWTKDNHGGHMARPAIVDHVLMMRPATFDLHTGQPLPQAIPAGGCGTYACARDTVLFRADTIALYDRRTSRTSGWERIRPDCWLSVIPAAGMILAPEGGGGCSCGKWMQTSVGFYPLNQAAQHGQGPVRNDEGRRTQ